MKTKLNRIGILFSAAIMGLSQYSDAANKTWAAGSGSWSVGSNWNPLNAPANTDAVFLTSADGAARTVTYDNPTGTLVFGNMLLNATAGGTFTVDQSAFTNSGSVLILGTTGRGVYDKSGGTLSFTTLNMATAGGSFGTFINSSGAATINTMNIGVFNSARVLLSGGSLNAVNVNLSQSGAGTVTQSSGRMNISGTLNVSDAVAGGTGVYELNGGTLQAAAIVINSGGGINHVGGAINSPSLTLNSGGTFSATNSPEFLQTFNQNGGAIVTDFLVGGGNQLIYNAGSFPNRLDSLGRVTFNGDMTMGNGWQNRFGATIDIAAARTITANGAGLAQGDGTITLSGTLNTTETAVGGFGIIDAPILQHQAGLHNVSNLFQVGRGFAAGTYNLNGGTLNVPATSLGAFVGVNQPGQLTIGGGRANISTLTVGAGAAGTITHNGTGDLNGASLIVGGTSTGNYIQSNAGAAVTVTNVFIAQTPAAAASEYVISAGTLSVNKMSNNGRLIITGGRVNMNQGVGGDGTLSLSNTGSLVLDSLTQTAVFVSDAAKIFSNPSGNALGVCEVKQLQFEEPTANTFEGQWDLTDNAIAIDYSGASPITDIHRYIKSGFAIGSWNGTGLSSNAAATSPSSSKEGLGFVEASDVFTTFPANFIGRDVDNTTVLVRCVLLGDTDLSRTVDIGDFARLAANFNAAGTWNKGDFNYDLQVDIGDFALLAANFNQTIAAELPREGSVPEPTIFAAIGVGALMASRRPLFPLQYSGSRRFRMPRMRRGPQAMGR